jgi:hypothetical protein
MNYRCWMVLILHLAQICTLFPPASTIGYFHMVNFHLYGNSISLAPQSTRPHAKAHLTRPYFRETSAVALRTILREQSVPTSSQGVKVSGFNRI